jgi:hypothetical protein
MLSNEELRKKFRANHPMHLLKHLDDMLVGKSTKPPLLTLHLASGSTIRGYLVGMSSADDFGVLLSQEIQNEGDGAADLCYIDGRRIEAVIVWNVDDYPGLFPAK